MEWHIMKVASPATSLGFWVENEYIISDDCEEGLDEILEMLADDKSSTQDVRRKLGIISLIKKDLVPLILVVEDDSEIFRKSLRLLCILTQPQDSSLKKSSKSQYYASAEYVLMKEAKEECVNIQFLKKLNKEISAILMNGEGCLMGQHECDTINDSMLILRNIFFCLNEKSENMDGRSTLLRYIFESGWHWTFLKLLTNIQKDCWSVSAVQLLSCFCQDDGILMNEDLESEELGSASDNCRASDHLAISDLEAEVMNKLSLVDNREDDKFSADILLELFEDEGGKHADCRQKSKLEPSEKDILRGHQKQFATQFFQKVFSGFVNSLIGAFVSDVGGHLDSSYILWTIAYFLKRTKSLQYSFADVQGCLNVNVFGYLIYEGITNCEKLIISQKQDIFNEQAHQKLHLTLCSLSALLKLVINHKNNSDDSAVLDNIQKNLAQMSELHQLFVFLLQHLMLKQGVIYLQEVIQTNHLFLLLMEDWLKRDFCQKGFDMLSHVRQFATMEIMQKYGAVLENFEFNSPSLNNAVLTMMYHVAGDCARPEVLMQLSILKTFTEMWDRNMPLMNEFSDLMEYVLQNFMAMAKENPDTCAQNLLSLNQDEFFSQNMETESAEDCRCGIWTEEEGDLLLHWVMELQESDDTITEIIENFGAIGITKTRREITAQLSKSGWPVDEDEGIDDRNMIPLTEVEKNRAVLEELMAIKTDDLLPYIVKNIEQQSLRSCLDWLQKQLLEAAYIKMGIEQNLESEHVEEPIARFSIAMEKPVPLFLATKELKHAVRNVYFYTLMHEIGIMLADDTHTLFPRIPHEWTSSELAGKAQQLGPIDQGILKFDLTAIEDVGVTKKGIKSTRLNSLPIDTHAVPPVGDHKEIKTPNFAWMSCVQHFNMQQEGINIIMDMT